MAYSFYIQSVTQPKSFACCSLPTQNGQVQSTSQTHVCNSKQKKYQIQKIHLQISDEYTPTIIMYVPVFAINLVPHQETQFLLKYREDIWPFLCCSGHEKSDYNYLSSTLNVRLGIFSPETRTDILAKRAILFDKVHQIQQQFGYYDPHLVIKLLNIYSTALYGPLYGNFTLRSILS